MASEIRVNKIENRSGLGTVTFADTGVDLAGIVTATTFSGSGASLTSLPAAQVTGTLPAISGANLTNLTATNLTGTIADARFPATLPAASAANLTSIPAANITGTLPALSAASLTNIPAANIVGVCTSGLTKTGGFGAMLQLKSTTKTDVTSTDSASYVDISGMSVTLTPSAGTKCYVTFHIVAGGATGYGYGIQIVRDSTAIANGDQYGSNNYYACRGGFLTINSVYLHGANMDHGFLDTHGADGSTAVTYKLQWKSPYEQYIYLNRNHAGHGNSSNESNYLSSTITVMEVAA